MNRKEFELISQDGEGLKVEFKESTSNIDKDMADFANSEGGRIAGEKVTEKVTENQGKILGLVSKNPFATAAELSAEVGISERKIKDNIRKLKQKGLLRRTGPDRGGRWEAAAPKKGRGAKA